MSLSQGAGPGTQWHPKDWGGGGGGGGRGGGKGCGGKGMGHVQRNGLCVGIC